MRRLMGLTVLALLLVVSPMLDTGAFADFIGRGSLPMKLLVDPVNLILMGIGFTFAGTRA